MRFERRTQILAALALAVCTLVPGMALADHMGEGKDNGNGNVISREFVQPFQGGGEIRVRFWGRDLDGDGVLYSMSGFLAYFLPLLDPASGGAPLPVGNEFIRVEVTFIDFLGIPRFEQVFDERETPIDLTPNFGPTAFMGFVYNLDGGELGDDPNEGFSLAPLAPSVSYNIGPLFRNILGPGEPQLGACGLGGGNVCASVVQLGFNATGLATLSEYYSDAVALTEQGKNKIGSKPCGAD